MMYAIHRGSGTRCTGSARDLVHLASTVERLQQHGLSVVLSDRNAALRTADLSEDPSERDDLVDRTLMGIRGIVTGEVDRRVVSLTVGSSPVDLAEIFEGAAPRVRVPGGRGTFQVDVPVVEVEVVLRYALAEGETTGGEKSFTVHLC